MEISDPQNSTFRKKCPVDTRELWWQCCLKISISLASTKVEHGWLLTLQDIPSFWKSANIFFLTDPDDGFSSVQLERCYLVGFLHVLIVEWLLEKHREGPKSLLLFKLYEKSHWLKYWILHNSIKRNFQRVSIWVLSTFSKLEPFNAKKNQWAIKNWTPEIPLLHKSLCLRV